MFDEFHPRPGDGREARTARAVSPRLKALLAAVGAVTCLGLAVAAWVWRWGPGWLPWVLLALAVWAVSDIGWQWHKYRRGERGEPNRKSTHP